MRTLHLYLVRQVLATLVMTVMVFTFVLLLGNVLKEVLALLVSGQASLWLIVQAIGLLIPYVLVFALPMGMLTATLLVFGRFSADHELTAARASGISLSSLIVPVILLGVFCSVVSAAINFYIAPQSRIAYKQLLFRAGAAKPTSLLREKQYLQDIPGGYTVYVGEIRGTNLSNVEVYQNTEEVQLWLTAPEASLFVDEKNQALVLTLRNGVGATRKGDDVQPGEFGEWPIVVPLNVTRASSSKKLSDMTFDELRQQLRKLDELNGSLPASTSTNTLRQAKAQVAAFAGDLAMPARVQLHRMVSFSFAPIGFTLIGIPLAIRAHRKETSIGIAISVVLVLIYYAFIIIAQTFDTQSQYAPHLITWIPNFLFQGLGGFLLWRAERGA